MLSNLQNMDPVLWGHGRRRRMGNLWGILERFRVWEWQCLLQKPCRNLWNFSSFQNIPPPPAMGKQGEKGKRFSKWENRKFKIEPEGIKANTQTVPTCVYCSDPVAVPGVFRRFFLCCNFGIKLGPCNSSEGPRREMLLKAILQSQSPRHQNAHGFWLEGLGEMTASAWCEIPILN